MLTRQPFWFIRHGQTDWNRSGRWQGRADVPLNMQGEAEAYAAVPHLKDRGITGICSSPLKRARRTADIIGDGLSLPVAEIRDLQEMDIGQYEGTPDQSWLKPWRQDDAVADVESFPNLRRRVIDATNQALASASHVLIVAHGGVFWALQHLCQSPFTPLTHCRPAQVLPVGETSWRIDMLTPLAEEA